MGTLNYLKKAAEDAARKAGAFAAEHKDTATGAVDKAATFVNTRTDGKYADTIAKAAGAAQTGVHKVVGEPAAAPSTPAGSDGTPMTGGVASDGTPMTGPR
ncbi:antitoxin [Kineococcus sp. R8]|uniref:Rv0909 family putative TA system antitoxin n=1 Tax=Kineococcus siccus TaxID=2696567 RepID=UPI001412463F|nr:antitoxin [Kineococcus siccus]